MRKLLSSIFVFVLLVGCSGAHIAKTVDTTQLTQESIVSIAGTIDSMCSQGVLKQSQCDTAAMLYGDAKTAYKKVLDAEYLLIDAAIAGQSTKDAEDKVTAAMNAWTPIATRILTLAVQYDIIKE